MIDKSDILIHFTRSEFITDNDSLNMCLQNTYNLLFSAIQKGIKKIILNETSWSNVKPVKNKKYWQKLDQEVSRHQITWKWVKGHSGHPENERADELANDAVEENN